MKSQWECVLENLGEWVGSFTTVDPNGKQIEDVPSVITLEGIRDRQAIHLILKRFYLLPGAIERYAKEVVWDFSSPPGIGAVYFETGAFSSGTLTLDAGVKFTVEFALVGIDRRFRTIQQYNADHRLDRVTFVREQRQGTTAPERPHLTIPDLLGTWVGTATTLYPTDRSPTTESITATVTISDDGYQWTENGNSIELTVTNDRLLSFDRDRQSSQLLLLPDGGYSIAPLQIVSGQPFDIEISWMYQSGLRYRLVRRYDSSGGWKSATFIIESLAL